MDKTKYINGNLAQNLKDDVYITSKEDIKRQMRVKKNQEKALQMNLPFVLALTVSCLIMLSVCVSYLKLQTSISAHLRTIGELEKELDLLENNNDALETRINTSINMDYIYKVATEDLGMVPVKKDQVIYFEANEQGYVRQLEDIPDE